MLVSVIHKLLLVWQRQAKARSAPPAAAGLVLLTGRRWWTVQNEALSQQASSKEQLPRLLLQLATILHQLS
jgi:hypothetical protein